MKLIIFIILTFSILVLGILCFSYYITNRMILSSPEVKQELIRAKSLDGKIDAVVIQTDVHSTVPTIYDVYVVDAKIREPSFKTMNSVFHATHVRDLKVFWIDERQLAINYTGADIGHFQNIITIFIDGKPIDVHIAAERKSEGTTRDSGAVEKVYDSR